MTLRRLLAGVAGGTAATAAANRLVRADEQPPDPLPGTRTTTRWRGFDVSYTTAGDPDDPDLVLLHGVHAAASSRAFAGVVDTLAEDYHVLAPDLPGFGHTDRPSIAYTSALYEAFVASFIGDVAGDDPAVVASSLTGAWAAMAAADTSVSALALVCPIADTGQRRPAVRRLLRTPVVGTAVFNALVSRRGLRWFTNRHAFYQSANVPAGLLDYQHRTSHQPNARLAPASFAGGMLDPAVDLVDAVQSVPAPVTLVWGREARITPLADGRALADAADVRLTVLDDAGAVPHVEHPASFCDALGAALPQLEHH
ncbi:alpha/beta fold hydrolase [Halobacterium salinarum]|uniref:alpha/beta fold hydrolase n=1 Tax=Halobacterium TaxID=2239 RepID=UPI001963FC0D|nr:MULTISPECIES: alpha/beta fold hydrolase [Halobacterium]MCF2165733.1 alpha/beta fold hydrolase [Halobacterium salinarum]MCF2166603.1 alpha/beta fold hydrolase [Halobacterium salinarum]MCF2238396.1 alpha/beta fold hydrolase [Halobacterium salinarum]MDL0139066.1 alpha/beta fold hydrolase [Halobacterium salinarum]QRY23215.1 alpha/beta fold hydrolase [Halobacterium sp. GSL-19]